MKKFFIIIGIIFLCIGTFIVINKHINGQTIKIKIDKSSIGGIFEVGWENKNEKPLSIDLYYPTGEEIKFTATNSGDLTGKGTIAMALNDSCQKGIWKIKVKGDNLGKVTAKYMSIEDYGKVIKDEMIKRNPEIYKK